MRIYKLIIRIIIRSIVKEEVRKVIGEVVNELKQPSLSSKPKKKIVDKKQFTKNSIINDILNETAETSEEWKQMGGGTYDSSKMNDVMKSQYGNMMNDTSQPNGNLAASMGINPDVAPDFLTKDYRKVMKAVDKKKGITSE